MENTIDMQGIRHLNLFERITQIRTMYSFKYNETIFFCVPKQFISRAVGENGRNVKRLSEILGRKIKIIPTPQGIAHVRDFIRIIISPVEFKDLDIRENEVVLNAGAQSKAALIGRNKRRLLEMKKIIKDFFGKDFRII